MDFGQFINALGDGYAMMRNTRQIESDEPTTHNMKTFCREVLCQITQNENIVLYKNGDAVGDPRTLSTYESFYRNNQRRSIRPIAEAIINGSYLQKEKFRQFLEQYFSHYSKEKVQKGFQQYGVDVSLDTIAEDITRELVRILTEEAAKPDSRRKSSVPVSVTKSSAATANVKNRNPPLGSPIKEIDDMLAELIVIGSEIAKYSKTDMFGLDMADDAEREVRKNLKASLQEKLTKLKDLASSLLHSGNHQNNSCFTEIFTLVQSLEDKDFIRSGFEFRAVSKNNAHVHRLLDILSKLQDKTDCADSSSVDDTIKP